ncbi:hypothetical protein HZF13_05495 [Lactiplantibacillus plantarum]|uniref:hypothetical protein n=1 Tax=Lactiplantibacillus plantarum TaxID=1590 RepID=UPI001CA53745|nr:hypothetical protein [Lactiplantibacillus plantarum]QYC98893.1 hypothetical protein HZF13_05495 [Lactiplantibacillus plantarum]
MTDQNANTTKSNTEDASLKESIKLGLIMPLAPIDGYDPKQFDDVRSIIRDAVSSISEYNFDISMVSDSDEVSIIQKTIVQNIYNYPLVIVDVSGKNANVMFELGMRLAFDMPIVLIKDEKTDYSFDTAPLKTIGYRSDLRHPSILTFKKELINAILGTYRESLDNPSYSPYLSSFGDMKVKKIENQSVDISDALSKISDDISVLKANQQVQINSSKTNRIKTARSLFEYYNSLLDDDKQTWVNLDLTDKKGQDYEFWYSKTDAFLQNHNLTNNLRNGDALKLFNAARNNSLPS